MATVAVEVGAAIGAEAIVMRDVAVAVNTEAEIVRSGKTVKNDAKIAARSDTRKRITVEKEKIGRGKIKQEIENDHTYHQVGIVTGVRSGSLVAAVSVEVSFSML